MRFATPRDVPVARERRHSGPPTPITRGAAAPRAIARFHAQARQEAGGVADARGQAAVEFVLVLPILITLLIVIVELGVILFHALTVNSAASAMARAAAVYRFNGEPNACPAARDAADQAANGLAVTVSCGPQGDPGDPFTVTVTYPWRIELPLLPISKSGQLTSKATEKLE
jgi:hypothetical protein